MRIRLAVIMTLFIGLALMGTAVGANSIASGTILSTLTVHPLSTITEQSFLSEANSILQQLASAHVLNGNQNVELIGQIGGAVSGVVVQDGHAYIGIGPRLTILDISDPTAPDLLSQVKILSGIIVDMDVSGNFIYVVGGGDLHIFNISNPSFPVEVGSYNTPGRAFEIVIVENYAYIADYDYGFRIIDITNPTSPTEVGSYDTPDYATGIRVAANYAYVADGEHLRVINIASPANPYEVGSYDTSGWAWKVAIKGSNAYVADSLGLRIINVSNPTTPYEVGFLDTVSTGGGSARDVAVAGNYAYIVNGWAGSLHVINITNPATPFMVSSYETSGDTYHITLEGDYAYITDLSQGLHILNVANPVITTETGFYQSFGSAYDVVKRGDYAYIASGKGGLRILNVANPATPIEVSHYDTPGEAIDIVVQGKYSYIADREGGLRIIDITDPTTPTEIGFYDVPGYARGIAVAGSYVFIAQGPLSQLSPGGLRIINITDPATPTEIGFFETPGGTFQDLAIVGDYAYIAEDHYWDGGQHVGGGMRIINILDPANPTNTSFYDTPGDYIHSVVVRDNFAFIADRDSGLRILNVANPTNPTEIGFFDMLSNAEGVTVEEGRAYVATLFEGLRVIDIADPTTLIEAGFYNISGIGNSVTSVDKYIYVASWDGGLFILRYVDPCEDMDDDDDDGLPNGWERCGYYIGGYDAYREPDVDLPAMGANPNIPDIFVEIDYMVKPGWCIGNFCIGGHTHKPKADAIATVVEVFNIQEGIHLHVDYSPDAPLTWGTANTWGNLSNGEMLEHREKLHEDSELYDDPTNWPGFDRIKNGEDGQGHFKPERRSIFHYALFVHTLGGGLPAKMSGISRNMLPLCSDIHLGASDFVVSLGKWRYGGTSIEQAGTFMHELGHNLGLCHGGDDNLMYKPNYLSVMNYSFQTDGLIKDGEDGYINYSNFGNNIIPPLVETSLNESIGLNGGAAIDNYGTRWYCRYLGQWWDRRDPNANSALDWNCNLVPIGVVEANINDGQWDEEDPTLSTLFAHNDWDNLVFDGGLVGLPIPSLNVLSPFKVEQQGGAMEELSFDIAQTFYRPYAIVLSSNGFDVVSPGLSTNIPITLTNIGALTTTVSFNNTTSTWFDLSSIPVSVTLAPSAILTYEISLNVPGSAATGSTQEITIEATSQESLRMRDTMTLHARVGPMAWFEAEPVTGNTPHLISFADLSIGEVNSWLWNFGDGFTSNQQNPSHVYTTPGIYTVSLTVTGPDGVDTYTRTDLVRVQPHQAYLPIIQR